MTYVVIGANFGDEGKGLMTDYLVRRTGAKMVTRFNGGAQAGHTVFDSGQSHVFSSFGSGTFAGAGTRLTEDVILNPHAALEEAARLGFSVEKILISKYSPVTTPYEIAINQAIEQRRGSAKHGSCGLGINETIERHKAMLARGPSFPQAFFDANFCETALNWIETEWLPIRLSALGFDEEASQKFMLTTVGFKEAFKKVMSEALSTVYSLKPHITQDTIYEGAQGLAIDEDLGAFPHVTRSNTGLLGALKHITTSNFSGKDIIPVYCSRTYLTRHGAGPFPFESTAKEVLCGNIPIDITNGPNRWQDAMRFAPLDMYALISRIEYDLNRNSDIIRSHRLNVKPCIALTCMDQSEFVMAILQPNGRPEKMRVADIPKMLLNTYRIEVKFQSYGPSAEFVACMDDMQRC